MNDITLVTTCMNRSAFLEQTLPTWVNQSVKEIIILDWSSKESIKPIIDKYQNGKIILVRVEGKEFFNKSKAQNLVHRLTQLNKSEYILSVDVDIILKDNFIESHPMNSDIFYAGVADIDGIFPVRGTTGTNLISYESFLKAGGYNELMEGWGFEDRYFLNNLRSILLHKYFNENSLEHIHHSNYIRTENYKIKDKYESNYLNEMLTSDTIHEKQDVIIYYPSGDTQNICI